MISSTCYEGNWDRKRRVWIPHRDCPLKDYTTAAIVECLKGKNVVVVGNSVSRHFFFGLLYAVQGRVDEESKDNRSEEKAVIGSCNSWNDYHTTMSCTEEQLKPFRNAGRGKNNGSESNCIYNVNHFDNVCVKQWENLGFSGNLTFIWVVDTSGQYLASAGLNNALSFFWKWSTNDSVDLVKEQFPKLWNAKLSDSSMLVYRQTTMACDDDIIGKVIEQNRYIKSFVENDTSRNLHRNKFLVELDKPTHGLSYYTDCVHHPGLQTQLHIRMFLNTIGC